MSTFQIALTNDRTEIVDGVDGYQQEGAMTTFFIRGSSRQVIDSWSVRVASYRTTEIQTIRRMTIQPPEPAEPSANDGITAVVVPTTERHDHPVLAS